MKFTTVVVAAIAAVASAYDEVTPCGGTEFLKLAPLAGNKSLKPCQDASGFSMLPPTGYPTPEQRAIMCKTPACHTLIESVIALKPSDCVLTFGNVKMNVKKLSEEFEPSCAVPSPALRA